MISMFRKILKQRAVFFVLCFAIFEGKQETDYERSEKSIRIRGGAGAAGGAKGRHSRRLNALRLTFESKIVNAWSISFIVTKH